MDDEKPSRREERIRLVLRVIGYAVVTVAAVCLLAVVGLYLFAYVAMSNYASNK